MCVGGGWSWKGCSPRKQPIVHGPVCLMTKAKIMIEGGFGFPGQPLAPMPGGLCWRLTPGAFTNGLWLIPGLIGSQP